MWNFFVLLVGVWAGLWLAFRALRGGNAAVFPYFQANRSENPAGFWAIVAFCLFASLITGTLAILLVMKVKV
jgi:hypothetical protein